MLGMIVKAQNHVLSDKSGLKFKFETEKYYLTIIDAPGNRDYVKNLHSGKNSYKIFGT